MDESSPSSPDLVRVKRSELNDILDEIRTLKSRVDTLEKQKETRSLEGCKVVELNVGGTVFTTLSSTLQAFPNSMLAALFSGRHVNIVRDEVGRVFIDRDPKYFGLVLNMLRGEEVVGLEKDDEARRRFASDCDYYGLPAPKSTFSFAGFHCVRVLNAHTNLYSVACQGDVIVAGGNDKSLVHVWNWTTGVMLGSLEGHEGPVLCAKIDGQSELVVTGSEDCTVRMWHLKSLSVVRVMTGHTQAVSALDVSGDYVCSASSDWGIRVWRKHTGECVRVLQATEPVHSVRLDTDDIIAGGEKAIHVWSRSKFRLMKTFSAHSKPPTNIVVNGPYIITSANNIKVWQKHTFACVRTIESTAEVTGLDVAGDYLISGDSSGIVSIRSISSGKLVKTVETHQPLLSLAVVQSQNAIIVASMTGQIQIWESAH